VSVCVSVSVSVSVSTSVCVSVHRCNALSSAAHEADKIKFAEEKQTLEQHIGKLQDEGELLRANLQAKTMALEELAEAKQKLMETHEKTFAHQTESYEARINTLETEVSELEDFKVRCFWEGGVRNVVWGRLGK